MGTFSIWHWLIVLVIVVLLFGKGRIPDLMSDVAKGIKSFKKGISDDEDAGKDKSIGHDTATTTAASAEKSKSS